MDTPTTLLASSIRPGYILWLTDPDRESPSYSDSDPDDDPSFWIKEPRIKEPRTMYGHPVMILHPIDENNFAVCLVSTYPVFYN